MEGTKQNVQDRAEVRASASVSGTVVARHPLIFTPAEAVSYLRVPTLRSLETLRAKGWLVGARVGKGFNYHKSALDACANRMFSLGDDPAAVEPEATPTASSPPPAVPAEPVTDPATAAEAYEHHFRAGRRRNRQR